MRHGSACPEAIWMMEEADSLVQGFGESWGRRGTMRMPGDDEDAGGCRGTLGMLGTPGRQPREQRLSHGKEVQDDALFSGRSQKNK